MALDFPSSPTNGQTYNGYVYSTSVGAWQAKPAAQSPFYTSDTPPSNPVAGDSWFNTNDGTMYIYTYDGNTYQWVEHRSQIAKSQVGLVPISPTSVTVSSGTATVDVSGLVTFTNARDIDMTGVFTSTYKNYRIIMNLSATGASDIAGWFTSAGTNITTGWYGAVFYVQYNNTTGTGATRSNGNGGWVAYHASSGNPTNTDLNIYIDNAGSKAQYTVTSYSRSLGGSYIGGYGTDGTTTGFRISPLTGGVNITGTMKVYGCN